MSASAPGKVIMAHPVNDTRPMEEQLEEARNPVAYGMRKAGIPLTRENWIKRAWGDDLPEVWCAEHECELPAELQDLSQFDRK
jgi:hypothetical protein